MTRTAIATLALLAATAAALAACGPPTSQPTTIGNTGTAPPAAATAAVSGMISDDDTGEPMVGATVVLDPVIKTGAPEIAVVIPESGRYTFPAVPLGRYDLVIFFADAIMHRWVDVAGPMVVDQHISNGRLSGDHRCTGITVATCQPGP